MLDLLLLKWHQVSLSSPEVIVRAPGRVNIIGEHTDYNEGFVMPGAISRSLYLLISKNLSGAHHWIACDVNEEIQFSPGDTSFEKPLWAKYIEGTISMYLQEPVPLLIMFGGDLPIGAGISSSSALVCGLLYGLHTMIKSDESKEEIAFLGSRVEREIIGLQGGIMDQFAIMLSRENEVMMLDCRSRTYSFIPGNIQGAKWLLINTKVHHQLIDSDYNQRAEECNEAVDFIKLKFPEVKSLRDVTSDMLSSTSLPQALSQRATFVVEENKRVHDMATALLDNDLLHAGQLLRSSHHGLQYQYEVSCEELNHLADFINNYSERTFARMMGGGFGGCVICLLDEKITEEAISSASESYHSRFGFYPEVIKFQLSDGVEVIT